MSHAYARGVTAIVKDNRTSFKNFAELANSKRFLEKVKTGIKDPTS